MTDCVSVCQNFFRFVSPLSFLVSPFLFSDFFSPRLPNLSPKIHTSRNAGWDAGFHSLYRYVYLCVENGTMIINIIGNAYQLFDSDCLSKRNSHSRFLCS